MESADYAIERSILCSERIATESFCTRRCKAKRSGRLHVRTPKRRAKTRSFFFGGDREMRRFFCEARLFSAFSKSCLDTVGWHGSGASLHGRCAILLTDSLPPLGTESGGNAIPAGYPVRKKEQDFCREQNPEESKPGSRRRRGTQAVFRAIARSLSPEVMRRSAMFHIWR